MIPCHYCGGTPELRHYKADMGHFAADTYAVVCKNCGARTNEFHDPEVVKRQWDRERVMRLVTEDEVPRYVEIDGIKVEVGCCKECPLLDERSEEAVPWCNHPLSDRMVTIDVLEGGRVADVCPLRKVLQ